MAEASALTPPDASIARSRGVLGLIAQPRKHHERDLIGITRVMQPSGAICPVKTLGERLRERRKQLGLSQEELGQLAGVGQSAIANLERGIRERPRDLLKLAQALQVRPEWLESGKGSDKRQVLGADQEHPTKSSTPGWRGSTTLPTYNSPTSISWEDLMSELPDEFALVLPDDSMADRAAKGTRVHFTKTSEFSPGDGVLVRDRDGHHYFREAHLKRGGGWQAVALNRAYPALDSEEDGLVVVAVFSGISGGWAQIMR